MSYYFSLQFKRCNRFLIEFGVAPFVGYFLLAVLFVVMSFFVFFKSGNYAEWIYLLIGIFIIEGFGSQYDRYSLLKSVFNSTDFMQVRMIENLCIAIPFSVFLLYNQSYLFAGLIMAIGVLLSMIPLYRIARFKIRTPFKRRPFEFTAGFRKTILYAPMIIYILIKAIQVENGNLAVFTLGFLVIICLSYYFTNEQFYFVWTFNKSPKEFLLYKIKMALWNFTLLSVPIVFISIIFFPYSWMALLLVLSLGYTSIITLILAKYSAFPSSLNLPQFILFSIVIWFPPMLLIVIPIFYKRAIQKLKPILS